MQEMWARILNFAMSAKNYFKFSSTSLCVSACYGSVVSINNQLFDVRIRYKKHTEIRLSFVAF